MDLIGCAGPRAGPVRPWNHATQSFTQSHSFVPYKAVRVCHSRPVLSSVQTFSRCRGAPPPAAKASKSAVGRAQSPFPVRGTAQSAPLDCSLL